MEHFVVHETGHEVRWFDRGDWYEASYHLRHRGNKATMQRAVTLYKDATDKGYRVDLAQVTGGACGGYWHKAFYFPTFDAARQYGERHVACTHHP